MNNDCEIAIIGCGPAGLSAAINVKARGKELIVLGGDFCSPKLHSSPRIDNYLGLPGITGEELRQKFLEHAEKTEIPIVNCRVNSVRNENGRFFLNTGNGTDYTARGVILALGVGVRSTIAGEKEFLGRGVSYCATCDALFFKGKTVAVAAYSKEGEEETQFLSQVCSKVYYIPLYQGLREGSLGENVEIVFDRPKEIIGEKVVQFLGLEKEQLKVDGIFIIRDSVPVEQLIPGIKVSGNFIEVSRDMASSVEGVYAAGDCTGKPFQLAKAVGEGQIAALSAVKYLSG